MSDETYYTVLNVRETASPAEIKTAYRDLIKRVHPDTNANLAPYLRKIAEDKTKEIIQAYTVLSSATKRRDYDRQLAEYRRQTMPPAPPGPKTTPPPTTSATSFGYCNKCGTSLYASGYCPRCSKFATPAPTSPASPRRPQAVRWFGYNWAPHMRWSRQHLVFIVLFSFSVIRSLFPDVSTSHSQANMSQSPENNPSSFRAGSDPERRDQSVPATPPGFTVDEKSPGMPPPSPTAPPKTKPVAKTPAGIFAVVTGR